MVFYSDKFLILILQVGDASQDLQDRSLTAKDREGGRGGGWVWMEAWFGWLTLVGEAGSECDGFLSSA